MLGRLVIAGMLVAAVSGRAAVLSEDFSRDPIAHGWMVRGDASLFEWNAARQDLSVTWDSARSNSFFLLPLQTVVGKSDDFAFAFEVRLDDIAIGTSANKPYTFEIAVGLLNLAGATGSNYFRGTGQSSTYGVRNAVEFDYFPATASVSATFAPTVISSNVVVKFSDNHPLELTPGDLFQVTLSYTAQDQTLRTRILRNGQPFGLPPTNSIKPLVLSAHPDFRVTHFAIVNYSDALQAGSTQFWGSVRAHGSVDNIVVTVPDPAVNRLILDVEGGGKLIRFASRSNWFYALERSTDCLNWSTIGGTNAGSGAELTVADPGPPDAAGFYRVKALRP